MTYNQAIAALVAQDVARWGEAERGAAEHHHRREYRTLGLALNALAARAELAGAPDAAELRLAADAALTAADWRVLRGGG